MSKHVIYLFSGDQPDPAILKGLNNAGCSVSVFNSVPDVLTAIGEMRALDLLVAEVQAGAIALLSLLKERQGTLPLTLLYDKEGSDIHTAIKALQFGVRDYLLSTDSDSQRELSARLMAERIAVLPAISHPPAKSIRLQHRDSAAPAQPAINRLRWDPSTHLIQLGQNYVRLSPIEGRIFNLLYSRRNQVVSIDELVEGGLMKTNTDRREGAKQLRPHLVRLRSKLERHPDLSHRIVNIRGDGYMLI
ncbi:MAG: winged helix-turn-helix domain-containing protein [Anaerolineae bacterium]|nr:winged helix-turn-helix domain-containing protein [Thermoflexales bacterium]MDW8408732.1 winged helix-turn-helix domain-containing protein [Anaerolineae bacterium]